MHRKKSLWEAIGGGPANFPNYDARTGLGYGTQSGYHDHRQYQGTYPYREPLSDNEEDANDEERDEDFDHKVIKKLSSYVASDPYAIKKSDPFYFFGAATRFESVERGITGKSISPIPNLYAGRESGMSSSNNWQYTKDILRTKATPHGTQRSSILLDPSEDQQEAPELVHLKNLIRSIFLDNMKKK